MGKKAAIFLLFITLILFGYRSYTASPGTTTAAVSGFGSQINKTGGDKYLQGKTIVIDPGHGGQDGGTTGASGTLEKNLTLRIALLVYAKLQDTGANVFLTRTNDSYISLSSRVEIANSKHADAFVSLHFNSNSDSGMHGVTGYYDHPAQKKLAQFIYSSALKSTGQSGRGLRNGDYYVLRENNVDAVLLELGCLSSPEEEVIVNSGHYQELAAEGIVNGLLQYFRAK